MYALTGLLRLSPKKDVRKRPLTRSRTRSRKESQTAGRLSMRAVLKVRRWSLYRHSALWKRSSRRLLQIVKKMLKSEYLKTSTPHLQGDEIHELEIQTEQLTQTRAASTFLPVLCFIVVGRILDRPPFEQCADLLAGPR